MGKDTELAFYLVQLRVASVKLEKLAASLESNKLQFSFSRSQGETADRLMELVGKYNELGESLAQVVRGVKDSTDKTRQGVKNADDYLATCWSGLEIATKKEG